MTEETTAVAAEASADDEKRTVVRTQNVKKKYTMGSMEVHALRGVDLEIYSGEYMSIMGPSGSGKSTLFNMVGGLDKPSEGKVYIDEVDVAQLDAYELAWLRCRKIGYIFQSFNLIPVMTALENVTLPMVFAGLTSDESRDKGMGLLQKVGLGERHSHKPNELSGGQQQQLAIARALVSEPKVLLLDEPTEGIQPSIIKELAQVLKRIRDERGLSILVSEQVLSFVMDASDRIMVIENGRIVHEDNRNEVNEDTIVKYLSV